MPPPMPPPPEKLADAPFDRPRADLVLRSSDDVHFRVLKGILSIASTVFADMFSIPSPPSEHQDEIQVVPVSEDSTALDLALRHIYPVTSAILQGGHFTLCEHPCRVCTKIRSGGVG
jgi:hypothetical protein